MQQSCPSCGSAWRPGDTGQLACPDCVPADFVPRLDAAAENGRVDREDAALMKAAINLGTLRIVVIK